MACFALDAAFNNNSVTLFFDRKKDAIAAKELLELADHRCLIRDAEHDILQASVKEAVDLAMNALGFGYDPRICPEWTTGVWG